MGQVGLEPTVFQKSRIYSPLQSPLCILTHMVWMERFELPTNCFVDSYSIPLSYIHVMVESAGLEPATLRFLIYYSTN